jgi:ubiquinone/menaquinone biosynthesis C-methylase UbiE
MEAGMANTASKPYKGWGMEGFVAEWYARQTARDLEEIRQTARHIATNLNSGSRVLEVAPGPGYLAIELARLSGASVTGVDISRSFVRIARDNASKADVRVEFEHGDAADLPFPDAQFDFVACRAAFKNFSRPLAAINEMHRVLKPGGTGVIIDLRKDFSPRAVKDYTKKHGLLAGWLIRLTFSAMLKKRAYTNESISDLAARSQFGQGEIRLDPIGFELWLRK